jgi:hypothetical protein
VTTGKDILKRLDCLTHDGTCIGFVMPKYWCQVCSAKHEAGLEKDPGTYTYAGYEDKPQCHGCPEFTVGWRCGVQPEPCKYGHDWYEQATESEE